MFWKPKPFVRLVRETSATVDFAERRKKLAGGDRIMKRIGVKYDHTPYFD